MAESSGRQDTGADWVRVVFDLAPVDGWPPARTERVWAVRVDDEHARLDNTPFFARGYASGDVVLMAPDDEGVYWVKSAVEYSGNCTIRIVPAEGGGRAEAMQAVLDAFVPLGVDGEGIERFGLVALNVPGTADIQAVKRVIIQGADEGRWHYEEGCVTPEWRAIE